MFFFEPTQSDLWQITIPDRYSDIFLYAPSESLKTYLIEYGYTLIPLYERDELYCDCADEVFYRLALP